ncbi:thiamine pyrophosphate-requiring protein [Halobacteriales archaeon Cl-PHB]
MTADVPADERVAATVLRTLAAQGVEYVFANLGTDHTPLLEAAATMRENGETDAFPEFVQCPHEFVAMSAAHGYAAVTGRPQAVLVHVDVGTQNLGTAMHNAHRANVPVFVVGGLAPLTDAGYDGSRDSVVHYMQDVFDQANIHEEYCRWVRELRTPADPAATVARGLERATASPPGPVYLAAAREALEAPTPPEADPTRHGREVTPSGADAADVAALIDRVAAADRPLVITSRLGAGPDAADRVESLVDFAEAAGAGVVEHNPSVLNFPRSHDLHAGFVPKDAYTEADLLVLADNDVPWVPAHGSPADDVPVVQVDTDPTKATFPHWDFRVDQTVQADPARTLAAVAADLDPAGGSAGREAWTDHARRRREDHAERLAAHRADDRLTPAVVSDALNTVLDESTTVMEDVVTNRVTALRYLDLDRPGSYHSQYGSGLGWGAPATAGASLATDGRVVGILGDGAYVFGNPTASAWLAAAHDAPTLLVVYNNSGWNAVQSATARQHPDGVAVANEVPESKFDPTFDLTAPAGAVDAHTATVTDPGTLESTLTAAADAVDGGRTAVVDVRIEPV